MWEAGNDYLAQARTVLGKLCSGCSLLYAHHEETAQVYHSSRATTCQALLLLGHREFGIGEYIRIHLIERRV
jgi:hypothetical protein